ncbi:MAG: FAD-dependent thymidylate synthase [Holosporaceae bacterium]|jgi:thymidylate synthase (FAD)|nr:FAD-dependent thymidylate synthase [Holosporaceae bacterium]
MNAADSSKEQIDALKNEFRSETVRITSPGLEEILYKPIPVLDHGFIRVVDYMGTDASIVQAARVSYGAGTKKVQEDRGLINYLMRHSHTTPFEMCEIKLHLKMPMFVARQWVRHRTASMNEYSARYSVLSADFYIPKNSQLSKQSKNNKQGKSDDKLDEASSKEILEILKNSSRDAYEKYLHMIDDLSLARELARTVLPVSVYTEMYWKMDLHNLLHFLKLREDSHAQYEIREYAKVILDIVKRWTPIVYDAFVNYRKDAVVLSKTRAGLLKRMLKGEKITQENSGLSKGEWFEFATAFDIKD